MTLPQRRQAASSGEVTPSPSAASAGVPVAPKLLLFVSEDWYFLSHRLPLAKAARAAGYEVVVVTQVTDYADRIRGEGFSLREIRLRRGGTNPLQELRTVAQLVRIYRRERPDIAHHVAIKPVIYGSVAAALAGVPRTVNALMGLGYVFISTDWTARLLRPLLTGAFRILLNRRGARVLLQNPDDREFLVGMGLVAVSDVSIVRGSGINLDEFTPRPEPEGDPVALLPARMLWDKGVGDFVEAARICHKQGVRARFVLVGDTDSANPASIPPDQLTAWAKSGVVEWWGHQQDMVSVYARCSVVCLPSYREGLPKVLLEGAASARAIVATDVPGCREVVRDGENGRVVPARNPDELAAALRQLLENSNDRKRMARRSREIAEQEFGIDRVGGAILGIYRELGVTPSSRPERAD